MQSLFWFRYSFFISFSHSYEIHNKDKYFADLILAQIFILHFYIWSSCKDIAKMKFIAELILVQIFTLHFNIWSSDKDITNMESIADLIVVQIFILHFNIWSSCKDITNNGFLYRVYSDSVIRSSYQYLFVT
jgi:hypothetical protein